MLNTMHSVVIESHLETEEDLPKLPKDIIFFFSKEILNKK